MEFNRHHARALAAELLQEMPQRLRHVRGVAQQAELLGAGRPVQAAAWLHDIGYAHHLYRTGMHALDGAMYLDLAGAPREVVSLVAFHTGAEYEALERGLIDQLLPFDEPDQANLDLLILADLTTSPEGGAVSVRDRLAEILSRYETEHPVHRAVVRSRDYLEECCRRAAHAASGQPM